MKFFKGRMEKFREKIAEGNFDGAIHRMKHVLEHGMAQRSNLASLMTVTVTFDACMKKAIKDLEDAKNSRGTAREDLVKDALHQVSQMDHMLDQIPKFIRAVAKEEKVERKGFVQAVFGKT